MLNRRRLLPVLAYPGIACRVWYPSDRCGRKWLKILRPIFDGAAGTINAKNRLSYKRSPRIRPVEDST